MDYSEKAFSITYGEQVENHARMEKIGELGSRGLTLEELLLAKEFFEAKGCQVELLDLKSLSGVTDEGVLEKMDSAFVLLIRNGVNAILSEIGKTKEDMFVEQNNLEHDKKAFMYGRVVEKHARHNLCFADFDRAPDYENKMGTIVSFGRVPLTTYVRDRIQSILPSIPNLLAEGNYYYDIKKTYIGYHGDTERRIVICAKLGCVLPLCYQWYYRGEPVGETIRLLAGDGDMYFMGEKAVGCDWKSRSKYTLRHAVGIEKLIKPKVKKAKIVV